MPRLTQLPGRALQAGRLRCSWAPYLLLALLAAFSGAHAVKLGPKPTAEPGLIVQVAGPKAGGVSAAAAVLVNVLAEQQLQGPASLAAAPLPSVKAIDPALNMFKVAPVDGKSSEELAAELTQHPDVVYAYPDAYVSIAGGIPWEEHSGAAAAQPAGGDSEGPRGGRKLAADGGAVGIAAKRKPPQPPKKKAPAKAPAKKPPPKKTPAKPATPTKPAKAPPARTPPAKTPAAKRPPPLPLARRPPPPSPPPPSPPPAPTAANPAAVKVPPNDAYYKYQWGLTALRAPQAWALAGSDSSSVLTCVVDTGVKWDHPDLAANLAAADPSYMAAHTDDNGHGTHVAGIIGAVGGNGVGISGLAFRAKILACKALDANGWGLISDVIKCITLCRAKGAKIINTSFVITEANQPLKDAVGNGTAAGVFFSGAAGNAENNNDAANYYPGGFAFPGNVAVANIANGDGLGYMSNYGATTVQLAAPGTDILSTWITPDFNQQLYTYETGTSMAAPYVSAAAALAMQASGGALTNAQVAKLLVWTSRPVAALKGKVVANGVVDLQALLANALAARKAAVGR